MTPEKNKSSGGWALTNVLPANSKSELTETLCAGTRSRLSYTARHCKYINKL
jgi:hypothetical protein